MLRPRSLACGVLLGAGLWMAGCGGDRRATPGEIATACDESHILAALKREAEIWLPGDAPHYANLWSSIQALVEHPETFYDAWWRDLHIELWAQPTELSPYAEALLVVPRTFRRTLPRAVGQRYRDALRSISNSTQIYPRASKIALLTRVIMGDRNAFWESAECYRTATPEERREHMSAYRFLSDTDLDNGGGEPLWELAKEILEACSQAPLTSEQMEWCQWLKKHPHRSCFEPMARIFRMYESLTPAEGEKIDQQFVLMMLGQSGLVAKTLASLCGSQALPLLRRNFENPWESFAAACLFSALDLGDPEALKHLIYTIPPEMVHAATQPNSFTDDVERLIDITTLLEPGTLPEIDVPLVCSGAEPIPVDFEKAWTRLYQAAKEGRVEFIAKPQAEELVFQVIYKDAPSAPH